MPKPPGSDEHSARARKSVFGSEMGAPGEPQARYGSRTVRYTHEVRFGLLALRPRLTTGLPFSKLPNEGTCAVSKTWTIRSAEDGEGLG